ncbi:unnamed protein product [Brugia pahangi]|uniref:Uncharacterized protein n=1 Tax=Brugia pahangi TaxID=6280 RepID=A0A0N4TEF5_BRUPA|nr:unnamed protein product [Brugia pahangi]
MLPYYTGIKMRCGCEEEFSGEYYRWCFPYHSYQFANNAHKECILRYLTNYDLRSLSTPLCHL